MKGLNKKQVALCACSSRGFIDRNKLAVLAGVLDQNGCQVMLEEDFCRKAEERSEDLKELTAGSIVACFPRAVKALLNQAGVDSGDLYDIRNNSVESVLEELGMPGDIPQTMPEENEYIEKINALPVHSGTDAWFPVIDKDRCTDCGKCHDFCLFGVYSIEGKIVSVVNPQNCKNNCPACARMCPSRAIVFPKYEKSPINGGTEEEEVFDPDKMDELYNERLKYRLQQRRRGVSLLKNDKK